MSVPTKLKDRYEIRQVLGQGGMGVVYRAFDTVVKREVALKTLRDALNRTSLQLFYKECDVLASMSHPNIVEIFDIGEFEEDGVSKPYFVMSLLRGVSLDKLIAGSSQRLTVERTVDIISQACRGLHAAHERGLIHRDLKPSNLFVMEDDSVKIIDFGLAHMVESGSSTGQKGTLLYMAPEQIEMKPLSPQTDIYAIGVTAYEALTRRLPWERGTMAEVARAILHSIPPPASELNPQVSQLVSRVIHKAISKQPFHRFASAREFGDTLQKALRNEPIEMFDAARIRPRVERALRAFEQGDYQFATEILSELEAEGHFDPDMTRLRRQIDNASRRKQIMQLIESARRRMEEEEYPLALQKIQEVLQLEPDNADALALRKQVERGSHQRQIDEWIKLARQHLDSYRFDHARQALQNVLQQDSRHSRALELLAGLSRREDEYRREYQEKEELYRAAMADYHKGELSSALGKLQRVLELDRRAPDASSPGSGATYQNLYNQVRSEHDAIQNSYAQARQHLADRNFAKALKICEDFLNTHPGHALFQALLFEVQENQRRELSSYIAEVDKRVEAEADLERRVGILREATERFPEEGHFQRSLKLVRDKRDLVNSIVTKATLHEERSEFTEALGQWEILRTIHSQYPGLDFEVERVVKRRNQQGRERNKERWVQRIDHQVETGDYARAAELLTEAFAEFPEDAELTGLEKVIRQGLAAREEAQALLAEGQRLCPEGKFEEGAAALRQACRLDPRDPIARTALTGALAERARDLMDEDFNAAETLLAEALELDANHVLARSLRTLVDDRKREKFIDECIAQARELQAAGDIDGALACVERGLASYPNSTRLAQLRGTFQRAAGDAHKSRLRYSEVAAAETVAFPQAPVGQAISPAQTAAETVFFPPAPVAPAVSPAETAAETAIFPPVPVEQPLSLAAAAVPAPELVGQAVSPAPATAVEPAAVEPAPPPAPPTKPEPVPMAMPAPRRRDEVDVPVTTSKAKDTGVFALGAVAALVVMGAVFFFMPRGRQPAPASSAPAQAQQAPPPEAPTSPQVAEPLQAIPAPKPAQTASRQPAPTKPPEGTAAGLSVSIQTTPAGATVVFDNSEISCQSPCSVSLPPGRHTASATLAGYRPALKIFQLPKESSLSIDLVPMAGMVRVNSDPPGAAILVDGQPRNETTPATLNLTAGKHTITVRKEGLRDSEQELEVKDGAFLTLQFDFSR